MCLIYLFTMGSQGHRCAVDERELFFSIEVEIPQVFCQKDTSGFFVIFFFALMIQVTLVRVTLIMVGKSVMQHSYDT